MRRRRSVTPDHADAPVEFVRTQEEYKAVLADAGRVFAIPAQAPEWVFRQAAGTVSFCEEGDALWNLVPIFTSLIKRYGDRTVSAVAKDFTDRRPSMRRIYDGRYKAFTMSVDGGDSRLSALLEYDPFHQRMPTLQYEDIVMVFGDSGQWGLYRDMDWELGLLWVNTDTPFWPQLPGHELRGAKGGAEIASWRSQPEQSQILIDIYSPHDPWRHSPARASFSLATCRAWLTGIRHGDAEAWAYVQEVIWDRAQWDIAPEGASWLTPLDYEAFTPEAVMAWLEERRTAGEEPWLETQALMLGLIAEDVETHPVARADLPWRGAQDVANMLFSWRERNGRRDAAAETPQDN